MIKLIKKSEPKVIEIKLGDQVKYVNSFHDGRSYEEIIYEGVVVKVNKVTIDFETSSGNVYRADKGEVTIR
jgi:hypothetical protein